MDDPHDAKDLQPFVLSDIQASNPDVRAVRKAWLKINLKEERKGKAQELEDSNKRARLLEDQKDDLDHILLGSTSVIRTRKEELKKAEYRICELGRLLDKSLMDKKEIKLDFEAQIRDLRDALKKCEEKLSREILQKEEAERNCHHLRYQLEEATRRFAVLESQEAWGVRPGFQQQQGMPGTRPVAPAAGLRPPVQGTPARADGTVLDDSFLNDTDNSKQNIETAEKKPEEMQNVILDSKERIELYRSKMQKLVLYKSRCDNRLNKITERASTDKRGAESLGKKYEEKYTHVANSVLACQPNQVQLDLL
ncbi:hypothetical protein KIW84_036070 [Lathyrus oleraceus]|uniref:Uncharacterized protein n=1 Tax=Pisum sativum TaxID=3888 RepID=A0A9D4Y5M9_PEA|nr:hypothetical protein KIW84_036070 [Pisum sativum]